MAVVTDVVLSVDRATHAAGSICAVNYSYVLICDQAEIKNKIAFTVWCELWGRDLLLDDLLGESMYDSHAVDSTPRIMNNRSFVVPCSVLDEDLGTDEIYLKVNAISSLGLTFSALSPVIRDRF